jgi:hypothetical protein
MADNALHDEGGFEKFSTPFSEFAVDEPKSNSCQDA